MSSASIICGDNMVRNINDKVQGKHHFAMIDEVDSVFDR